MVSNVQVLQAKVGGKHAFRLPSLGEKFPLVVLNVRIRPFGNLVPALPGQLPAEPHSEDVAWKIMNRREVLICETTGPTGMKEGWKERKREGEKRKKTGGVYVGVHTILACFTPYCLLLTQQPWRDPQYRCSTPVWQHFPGAWHARSHF